MNPLVSIVMPVYNGADFLSEAIESALAQTYKNIEIIVINDGSSDDGQTEKIISSYGSALRYVQKPNGGTATALNVGIGHMAGDYFSWLSHDDIYLPHKVEAQIELIDRLQSEKPGQNLIVYSDYEVFSDGRVLAQVKLDPANPGGFRCYLTLNNSLHGCSLLIPKAAFDASGLFDESLRTTHDYDLWFRMAKGFDFVHLRRSLLRARSHPAQGSNALRKVALNEINLLLGHFVERLSESEIKACTGKTLSLGYADIARNMAQRGFLATARYASRLSLHYDKNDSFIGRLGLIFSLLCVLLAGAAKMALRRIRQFMIWLARN